MAIRGDHHETTDKTPDERDIHELFENVLEDWARGDRGAYGSRFTKDADYVAFDGTVSGASPPSTTAGSGP